MSRWQANLGWGTLVAVMAFGIWLAKTPSEAQVAAPQKSPAPETLLPADAVVYIGCDGMALHQAEFEKTAAYQALYESGLMDAGVKLIKAIQKSAGGNQDMAQFAAFEDVYNTLSQNGLSLAVSVPANQGPPQPYGILVLHQAAKFAPQLAGLVMQSTRGEAEFKTKEVSGRKVTSGILPNSPGVELGWWTEGKHLVVTVGMNAVASSTAIAAGDSPNITKSALWKKYRGDAPEGMNTLSWLDLGSLRQTFGQMPLPQPDPNLPQTKVDDLVKAVGLDTVGAIVSRSGFKGEAMWSESLMETPGPRKGLLAYASDKSIQLKDLPPMPASTMGFHACTVDWSKAYTNTVEIAENVAKLGPPDAEAQLAGLLDNLPAIVGFDPEAALFKPLGDVTCVYADGQLGLFGTGVVVAQKIDDEKTFNQTLKSLLARAAQQTTPRELMVKTTKKHGRDIVTLEVGGGFFNPSYTVADGWFVAGLFPQTVESFFLRLDGKLPRWKPSEKHETAFAALPKEFTSLTVTDPETGVKTLMSLAPLVLPIVQAGLQNSPGGRQMGPIPFSVAELPPAELVAQPLFPNVRVQTVNEDGIQSTSRNSLPAIPLLDSGGGVPAVAVAIALLLPAVQQARQAARRSTSKNNLKQLGLAMHNHHDVHGKLPIGTHPNEKLKPEKRLSWVADVLPFIDEPNLAQQINFDESWDSRTNAGPVSTPLVVLTNPGEDEGKENAPSHYVAIAGIGKDAPTLPITSKKAGMFGYNRVTKFRDITDGLSNTLMISEASKDFGPWAEGGNSTLRSLTKKPYINGPDGIGGPWGGKGCNMLMGDGSVHFMSSDIDPSVLEALSTIRGGEVVGDF